MDVGRPLTALIPTLDGPVLEVLARTNRPLTGREVHRLAGVGSESGVRLVLRRLEEHGLVTTSIAGRATLYVANREHLAWGFVDALVDLRRSLLDRMRALVEVWPSAPTLVAVFGSTARGDGDMDSDIDLLVVRPEGDEDAWDQQLDALRERVERWTGNACQIYALTEAELAEHAANHEPIVGEWLRDAVTVTGEPLSRLLSRKMS